MWNVKVVEAMEAKFALLPHLIALRLNELSLICGGVEVKKQFSRSARAIVRARGEFSPCS